MWIQVNRAATFPLTHYLVVLLAGFVVLGKYFLIFVLWQAAKRTMYGFYVEGLECLAFTEGAFTLRPPACSSTEHF